MSFTVRRLGEGDVSAMRQLNVLFAEAFEDPASYASAPPGDEYVERLLARDEVVVVVARRGKASSAASSATCSRSSSRSGAKSTSTTLPWPKRIAAAALQQP